MTKPRQQSGWGGYPRVVSPQIRYGDLDAQGTLREMIARGMGRGYGDCALSERGVISMLDFNKIESLDPDAGIVIVEAGVTLEQLLTFSIPRGWFVPVSPGTKFVTVGGMLAADVHGKNHHRVGTIRNFVDWIDVFDGCQVIRLSRHERPDWFEWTIGGMGLTGIILRAQIRLLKIRSAQIRGWSRSTANLDETLKLFNTLSEAEYSVAWVDSSASGRNLGRAIVSMGQHVKDPSDQLEAFSFKPARLRVPHLPMRMVTQVTTALFNSAYYHWAKRTTDRTVFGLDGFFYPLDGLLEWNRLYGRQGFAQYQVVFPMQTAESGIREVFEYMHANRLGSPLTVLKKMGASASGISFPMEGFTLTLDFPMTSNLAHQMNDLIAIGIRHNGRFYLAKDAFLTSDQAFASDPRLLEFAAFRQANHLQSVFSSALAKRVGI